MNISTTDARGLYTKKLIEVYREQITPMSFLRSFFKPVEEVTLELSIEVERGTEKIAVDVERGTEGNRNTWSKSTEKIFIPPYYREYFDATQLALYDKLFGSSEISSAVFTRFIEQVAEKLVKMREKIERRYELQCAQVFETGIVTLDSGINIDFKRKSASLIDGTGTPWSTGSTDIAAQMESDINFLRQKGKAQGAVYNAILGSSAFSALVNNDTVKERADIRNFKLDDVAAPQRNSVGASFHGEISAGPYRVRLWSYPEYYDNAAGVSTPYINPKKVVYLPENPRFTLGFAAVPQLINEKNPVPVKGAYVFGRYIDERAASDIHDIKSAGLAIPVAVDQIVTRQVIS